VVFLFYTCLYMLPMIKSSADSHLSKGRISLPLFSSDQWVFLAGLLCLLILTPTLVTRIYEVFPQTEMGRGMLENYAGGQIGSEAEVLAFEDTVDASEDISDEYPEDLVREIFVIYDGATVVLSPETVRLMYRKACPYADQYDVDTPCVNVGYVREYTSMHLRRLLDGNPKYEVATSRWGSFSYRVPGNGPDEHDLVSDIVSLLSVRARLYRQRILGEQGEMASSSVIDQEKVAGVADVMGEYSSTVDVRAIADDTIFVENVEIPGTDGSYAEKYIEIDDSQQHLYAWEGGELAADYEVSGFFDEYAVYGVFSIKNKSLNAWSPIAEKWMPFWMAYYFDPKQQAWFGIHELVYWTDKDGVYHEESSDSIGNKKSGGCIRLDRGKAEVLYDWVDVGIPVLIHP
jgi:lipoprotein-anchoring transpeptidase ErfK/SrfK